MVNILLGATGSVASIKIPALVAEMKRIPNVQVKVVPTEAAHFFFKDESFDAEVHTDKEEWDLWRKKTDPILHIELRNWADIMVIAPLDANTLAKIANGLCDNLLTCVLRAWDPARPVIVCPAMNTNMWHNPFTAKHIDVLQNFLLFDVVEPISKQLACGDTGIGAMAEPAIIVERTLAVLDRYQNEKLNQDTNINEGDLL